VLTAAHTHIYTPKPSHSITVHMLSCHKIGKIFCQRHTGQRTGFLLVNELTNSNKMVPLADTDNSSSSRDVVGILKL
jgi:hypothetical protein